VLVGLWVAITTWSYGRTAALPKANRGRAFEIVPNATPAESSLIVAENLTSPAVGS